MMRRALVARLAMAALVCGPAVASAKNYRLTLEQAIALARRQAPEVVVEGARVREVEAERIGASVLLRENPEIEGAAGRRRSEAGERWTDLEAGVTQMFEVGGKRAARIAVAEAATGSARSRAADAGRRAALEVAVRFLRALHARERLRIAEASAASLDATRRAIERRAQKGDVAALEVNLAASASVRARAQVIARQVDADELQAGVAAHLGLGAGDSLELVGTLDVGRAPAAEELLRRAAVRPDVAALLGEERAGKAEERLGRAMRWPDLGVRGSYAREGDEQVLLGGIVIRLPLFDRGQEARAAGRARSQRARAERRLLTSGIARDIRVGSERRARLEEAVKLLRDEAVPILEDSEKLLARSLETGLIGLGDYLAARRELLAAREEYLDRLLDVAIAGVELDLGAGGRP
jgi:cobalt-zinc-cadmium efflux system outer membrane protein